MKRQNIIFSKYGLNTMFTFLLSIIFIWFFFFCKHNGLLSKVNVFDNDPYDAVGSIGIQVSFLAAILSLIRIVGSFINGTLKNSQKILILRNNLISILSIEITMISNLISIFRFKDKWINNSTGIILVFFVISFLFFSILMHCWTLFIAKKISSENTHRNFSFFDLWPLLGFFILAIYPVYLRESITGAIYTAYLGMIIHVTMVRSFSLWMLPQTELKFIDMIDILSDLYSLTKNKIKLANYFFNKIEMLIRTLKLKSTINWLNPRKHRWNIIIIFGILVGVLFAFNEGIGENWIGYGNRAILLFSIFVGGELIIIFMFYLLFSNYLGLFHKESKS
jgi:hypothetical protein